MANAAFASQPAPDDAALPRTVDESAVAGWRVVLPHAAMTLPDSKILIVGSDARAGLQLQHASVQPMHARLTRNGDVLVLERIGSGVVMVGNRRVDRAELRGGEDVRFGAVSLRVEREHIGPTCAPHHVRIDEDNLRAALMQEVRHLPWLAISIAVHAFIYLLIQQFAAPPPFPGPDVGLPERFVTLLDVVDPEVELTTDDAIPEATPLLAGIPDVIPEAPIDDLYGNDMTVDFEEAAPVPPLPGDPNGPTALGVGGSGFGLGTVGGHRVGGFVRSGVNLTGVKGPLGDRLRDLRATGVDLVFLIDTTASMDPFLSAAKRTVDEMITELSRLVPNLRIGMIAYRDRGDEYLTKAVPIGTDRYRILNFLQDLEAAGGQDTPEDVLAAFQAAFDDQQWRPKARRVLILVADAPPHAEDMSKLRMKLREATNNKKQSPTVISSVFAGSSGLTQVQQEDAEKALREIAKLGGGEFAPMAKPEQIKAQIVDLTLGGRFSDEAARVLRRNEVSSRKLVIDRLCAANDVDGLIQKLRAVPIEPQVVAALVKLESLGVAMRCYDLVTNDAVSPSTREAALYVLKRITGFNGSIDFGQPLMIQDKSITELHDSIEGRYRPKSKRDRR